MKRYRDALRGCVDALDRLMGDTDPDDCEADPDCAAMQAAVRVLGYDMGQEG